MGVSTYISPLWRSPQFVLYCTSTIFSHSCGLHDVTRTSTSLLLCPLHHIIVFSLYSKSSCVRITLDNFSTMSLSRKKYLSICMVTTGRLGQDRFPNSCVWVAVGSTFWDPTASASVQPRQVLISSPHLQFTGSIIDFRLLNRDNPTHICMQYFAFFLCMQDNRFYRLL
jgi:hypothetical protein